MPPVSTSLDISETIQIPTNNQYAPLCIKLSSIQWQIEYPPVCVPQSVHKAEVIWQGPDALAVVRPTRVYLLDFFCSGIQVYLLLSAYLSFISFL